MKKVNKIWGRELWVCNNDRYCGKILELKKDFQSSLHKHKEKDETFLVLEGKVLMEIPKEERILFPYDSIRIKPFIIHRFTGLEDSKIIEFSTHHDYKDTYRVEKSRKVK